MGKRKESSRPRMVYGYCRVSHEDSAESGLGIASQLHTFNSYLKLRQECNPFPPGVVRGTTGWEGGWSPKSPDGRNIRTRVGSPRADGVFVDQAISAYKKPLRTRPAGGYLDRTLQDGDIVVFPKLDRAFRNLRDFANTLPDWESRGISVIFVQPSFDMTEASGKLCGSLFAAFAEFESSLKSERPREALMQAWRVGKPSNAKKLRVFGFRQDMSKQWKPWWNERKILLEEVVLAPAGKPWCRIRDDVERRVAHLEGRDPRPNRRYVPQFSSKKPRLVSEYTERNLESWLQKYRKYPFPLLPSGA